jgi:hypothetical protein
VRATTRAGGSGMEKRGWEQGSVGWGVRGTFGDANRDVGSTHAKKGNLVKDEKGRWVKARGEERGSLSSCIPPIEPWRGRRSSEMQEGAPARGHHLEHGGWGFVGLLRGSPDVMRPQRARLTCQTNTAGGTSHIGRQRGLGYAA